MARQSSSRRCIFVAFVAAVSIAAQTVLAAIWDDSNQNSTWHNANNWQANVLPGATEAVTFPFPVPFSQSIISLTGDGTSTFEVAGSLTFNANYTLQSGALELGSSGGPITTANSVTAEIDSQLVGTQGLTKLGNGTLILNGSKTFTGSVVLSAGTTSVTSDSNLGSTSNTLTIQSGAVLNAAGGFATQRTVTLGAGGGTINAGTGPFVILINGLGGGADAFTSAGNGTLVLDTASARTGTSLIQNGTLIMGDTASLGSGAITVNSNGILELPSGNFSVPVNLGATGTLTGASSVATTVTGGPVTVAAGATVHLKSLGASAPLTLGSATPNVYTGGAGATTLIDGFSGKVILATANDYAGDWQVNAGTLRLANASGLGTGTSAIVVNGTNFGVLELPGVTLGRAVTLTDGSTLVADNGASTTAPISVAANAAVTLSLKTGGTFILGDSANDLTGGGGSSPASTIKVTSNSAAAVLRLNQSSDYTGNWSIGQFGDAGGVVEVNADSVFGNAANTLTVNSGWTLRATASFSTARQPISVLGGTLDVVNGSTFTIQNAILGIGSTATHKTGNGTLALSAGVSGSGGSLEIDAGTVVEQTSGVFSSAPINVNATGTLQIANISVANAITLRNGSTLTGTGGAQITSAVSIPSGAAVTIASGPSAADALTLGGGVSLTGGGGATTINVSGSGMVILNHSSAYAGGWSVNASTLQVVDPTGLGTGAATVLSGGVIELNNGGSNTVTINGTVNLNDGGTLRGNGNDVFLNGTITVAPNAAATLAALPNTTSFGTAANQITGGAGATLTVAGGGNVKIPFSNNYAGSWKVNAGSTLWVADSSGLGTGVTPVVLNGRLILDDGVTLGRSLTLNSGATLLSFGTAGVSGTSTVASNAAVSLQAGFTGATLTMGAIAGGGGTSTISTGGTVTILAQDSSYAGAWTVGSGSTLQLDTDTRLGVAANPVTLIGTLATTGTFASSRVFTAASGGVATFDTASGTTLTLNTGLGAGSASLSKSDTGTLILKAASTRTGFTLINGGVLRIENATALGAAGGNSITVFPGATMEVAGVTLNKPMFLQGGTLRGVGTAGSNGVLAIIPGAALTLATGASSSDTFTIGDSANDLTNGTGGSGTSTITVSGSGKVVLAQSSNYTDLWAINSGTLRIGNAAALGSGATAVVINSAALEIGGVTLNRPLTLNNGAVLRGTGTSGSNGIATVAASAAITLASGASTSDVLTIGDAANDLTGGGSGSTITVSGSGKVVLAQSSNYAGNWTISSGALAVNGAITGPASVNSTGTLQGTGTIGGLVTVANGGTISPGNSAGTLTVGSLSLNAGSQTKIEIGGLTRSTQYDSIISSGGVSLGGTLSVSLINGFTPARLNKFDILDWGTRSGVFAALQLPALSGTLGWNASNLYTTGTLSVIDLNRLPGDMNHDNLITAADLPLMELALTDKAAYELQTGVSDTDLLILGDTDESGTFDNGDMQGLLNELIHGTSFITGTAPVPVPEPASGAMIAIGTILLLYWRRHFQSY